MRDILIYYLLVVRMRGFFFWVAEEVEEKSHTRNTMLGKNNKQKIVHNSLDCLK